MVDRPIETRASVAVARDGRVEILPATGRPETAREAWQRALLDLPDAEWAAPVLHSAEGRELLPTGSLVVRFRDSPSRSRLASFAAELGLVVVRRNPDVPRQVSFRPRVPREAYLPDLVNAAAGRPEVEAAWAGTRSRYRREG